MLKYNGNFFRLFISSTFGLYITKLYEHLANIIFQLKPFACLFLQRFGFYITNSYAHFITTIFQLKPFFIRLFSVLVTSRPGLLHYKLTVNT